MLTYLTVGQTLAFTPTVKHLYVSEGHSNFPMSHVIAKTKVVTLTVFLSKEGAKIDSTIPCSICCSYSVFLSFHSQKILCCTFKQTSEWPLPIWYYQMVQLSAKCGQTISGQNGVSDHSWCLQCEQFRSSVTYTCM